MKIVFVVKYYDNYIENLERSISNIETRSYSELLEIVNKDFFMMYNSYQYYLNQMDNVEAHLLIPNWKTLQNKWAVENKIENYNPNLLAVCVQQIKLIQPDILFFNSNFEYYDLIIPQVKNYYTKLCAWVSCPLPNNCDFKIFDQIFTLFPPHKIHFESLGINTFLTTAGFDPRVNESLKSTNDSYEVTFVGGIGAFHKKRERYLKFLIRNTNILLWGYGYKSANFFRNTIKQILSKFVYAKRYQGSAWGLKMFQILHDSKISFNCHADLANEYAVNMRLFEATGVGSLLVTEYTDKINDFFVVDSEVICYTSEEDALKKIRYYLENEEQRLKIAKAGQEKTLKTFSYEKISASFLSEFEKLLM